MSSTSFNEEHGLAATGSNDMDDVKQQQQQQQTNNSNNNNNKVDSCILTLESIVVNSTNTQTHQQPNFRK